MGDHRQPKAKSTIHESQVHVSKNMQGYQHKCRVPRCQNTENTSMQQDKGRENMRPDMAVDQLMIATNSMVNKCKQNQRKNMQKKVTCKKCNKGCQHMQTQGQCCNMRAWLTVLYRTMDDKLAHLRATGANVETHKQHMHKRIACIETSNATCAQTHQLHKKAA